MLSLLLCSLVLLSSIVFSETVTINTQLGRIKGNVNRVKDQQTVYSFYGIQYAKAPIGENRFLPSQLNETKWNEIHDGTKYGPVCWQSLPPNGQTMDEDCLYLNIWTPKLNSTEPLLPVMVWIQFKL